MRERERRKKERMREREEKERKNERERKKERVWKGGNKTRYTERHIYKKADRLLKE